MCGICGITKAHGRTDSEALRRMADAMRHRGPDDEGYYTSDAVRGASVALGFRRLAIIDLDGGNQPIANEDGTVKLVFNGEIYNFRELRRELDARGHRFATEADTEVIVHLYEELGPDCVDRLNGMFAFALWDEREQRLLLARDRFGKKPLYYAEVGEQLIFASELKGLLQHPDCPRGVDHEALGEYLALEYVPAPRSIVRGVKKLPRGHRLLWRGGRSSIQRYWDVPPPADGPVRGPDEYVEEFRERFWSAVERRLLSDVPLGAFLSGGIDSSSVVAAMADLAPAGRLKTFSIGFAERSFDEAAHARRVAEYFGTEHYEDTLTPAGMLRLLPDVIDALDEPLADASVIPTYLLSRFTREHVTVALGGDGGDELLAGYPTFAADRLAERYAVPSTLHRRVVVPLVDRLPVSTANFSLDFKAKRFVRGVDAPPDLRHAIWLGSFSAEEQRDLLKEPARDPYRSVLDAAARAPASDRTARLSYLYVDGYLQDDILAKVDRMSMANSLEVRAPFLDVELTEFLAAVPSRLKLHGRQSKVILKRAMAGRLPPGIVKRPKKGFGVPIGEWFKKQLRAELLDVLSPSAVAAQGLFEPRAVERLVREHLDGTRDNRKQLWTLFCFQRWHANYITDCLPAASVARDSR